MPLFLSRLRYFPTIQNKTRLRKDIEDIQNGLISDPFEIIDEGEEREVSMSHTPVGTISKVSTGRIYW